MKKYGFIKSASDAVRAELFRLWDMEREYKRLTDRDEKGRFVKNE